MPPLELTIFDYVAFIAMAVVFFGLIYLVIWVGDLPAKIAAKRNHPQVAAVQAMAWLGLLFTGGVVYVLAFVWAYYDYSQESAANSQSGAGATEYPATVEQEMRALRNRLAALETTVSSHQGENT